MTDSTAIENINGYTEAQEAYHNTVCDNKIYSIISKGELTQAEIDEVDDTKDHLDLMSQSEIDSDISTSLNDDSKTSRRPC